MNNTYSDGKPPFSGASLFEDQSLLIRTCLAERLSCTMYDEPLFTAGDCEHGSKGIFNPSCAKLGNQVKIIARGERTDATLQGRYITEKAVPLLSEATLIDRRINIHSRHKPLIDGMPSPLRSEDWRLFIYNGEFWTNFTIYYAYNPAMPQEIVHCRTCIGKVEDSAIRFVREVHTKHMNRLDKNWAFFEHDGKMKFVKTLEPFVIGTCDDDGTVIDEYTQDLALGRSAVGSFVANSTNPILLELPTYGEVFFMVFHCFAAPYGDGGGTRQRTYFQHAFIFDKDTLAPVAYTRRPFLCGGSGRGADDNVIYVSGALDSGELIHLVAGEGDVNSRIYGIQKHLLSQALIEIK